MFLEGIQSEDLRKICSNAGDKKTPGSDSKNKVNENIGNKYRIHPDHEILPDHGVFHLRALSNELVFEGTLFTVKMVGKGSDPTELFYELTNIQLQYEVMYSVSLAQKAESIYINGKNFVYQVRESS